ncbi:hypothetical protein TWF481_003697 [Arthrobotrys musiformis]|uniref:Uncharacterized protein n=1 Tax=Arthrobotrys musiformis TaxID=47236 RepID=A0AAV9WJC1_9PEZI
MYWHESSQPRALDHTMSTLLEIPRALHDIRLDLIRLNLPASNSDSHIYSENTLNTPAESINSEVLKAKYFTEARYYPNYATATGHSEFLKKRTPSDPLFTWVHLANFSDTTWGLDTTENKEGCQFTYPPPEKIVPRTIKSIVLETLGCSSGDKVDIDARVVYNLGNNNSTTDRVSISIRREGISAGTKISCTGLDPEKCSVEILFDGAIFVVSA